MSTRQSRSPDPTVDLAVGLVDARMAALLGAGRRFGSIATDAGLRHLGAGGQRVSSPTWASRPPRVAWR